MKPLILGFLLTFGATCLAGEHLMSDGTVMKTDDESVAAQLCMAALESREAMQQKAKELKIHRKELRKVVCNDMSLVEFARTYRDDMREWSIATVQ